MALSKSIALIFFGAFFGVAYGCDPTTTSDAVSGVKHVPEVGTDYARCANGNEALCRVEKCDSGKDEWQLPSDELFSSLGECQTFEGFYLCYDATNDVVLCTEDFRGCPTGYTQVPTTDTTYSSRKVCDELADETNYVRCLDSSGRRCSRGLGTVDATCASTEMLQPAGTVFTSKTACESWSGELRCYSASDQTYECVSDLLSGWCSGHATAKIQVSESMSSADCQNYYPEVIARCISSGMAACRPGGTVTYSDPAPDNTEFVQYPNLTMACLAGETLTPSNIGFSSRASCEDYDGYTQCYNYTSNSFDCVRDYNCIGMWLAQATTADSTSNTCGGTFTPSSWVSCQLTSDATTTTCRPIEMGCYDGTEIRLSPTTWPDNTCTD